MGAFCSCFDAEDPLDNTHSANIPNNDNRIIPNFYDKIATGMDATAATTSTTNQFPPGPLLIEKKIGGHRYLYPSSMEEEECPTCLEEYTPENPKITTKCSHHFHLACIYEWLERNQNCPVCSMVMSFNDL